MTAQVVRETMQRVFSDAHVVDVDFSHWDKHIAIWVLADHLEDWTERCPLVVVEFIGVRECSMRFNHYADGVGDPDQHVQWRIDDLEILDRGGLCLTRLYSGHTAPHLEILCERIEIRKAAHSILDSCFPGWNKPYSALARPGIEGIANILQSRPRGNHPRTQ